MLEIGNSWWMYLLGAFVTVFVLATSVFFIVRAYKDAKELNMDKKILKKVIIDSTIFTVLPSISILIGIIALMGSVGVALPWIRLTVIGALHYEGTAIKTALDAFGESIANASDAEQFVTVAFVMTLGIIVGPLFCLFGFKAYDKKVLAKTRDEEEEEVEVKEEAKEEKADSGKKNFGSVLFNAVFISMVSVFIAYDVSRLIPKFNEEKETEIYHPTGYVPLIVIGATFLSMFIFDILEKKCKQKWLANFSLGLSMIIGMAVAALVEWLVK